MLQNDIKLKTTKNVHVSIRNSVENFFICTKCNVAVEQKNKHACSTRQNIMHLGPNEIR